MKTIELTFITGEEDEDGVVKTCPTLICVDQIRNIHPRKYGYEGTRVVFHTGAAVPVTELYEAVKELIKAA